MKLAAEVITNYAIVVSLLEQQLKDAEEAQDFKACLDIARLKDETVSVLRAFMCEQDLMTFLAEWKLYQQFDLEGVC